MLEYLSHCVVQLLSETERRIGARMVAVISGRLTWYVLASSRGGLLRLATEDHTIAPNFSALEQADLNQLTVRQMIDSSDVVASWLESPKMRRLTATEQCQLDELYLPGPGIGMSTEPSADAAWDPLRLRRLLDERDAACEAFAQITRTYLAPVPSNVRKIA